MECVLSCAVSNGLVASQAPRNARCPLGSREASSHSAPPRTQSHPREGESSRRRTRTPAPRSRQWYPAPAECPSASWRSHPNFTRRCLLLQRFLEFLEQPHVLNGDHRLVGESFEQLDLRRGEGTHLDATCGQCSNEFPLLTKGNGQKGARVPPEPTIGKSFCARTSGMWSVPCSRIQRNCGSSILISTRPMGTGPK